MPANLIIVTDHDEVVDFRALADAGRLKGRAVDGTVGADLDVVANFDASSLGDFRVLPVDEAVAEAVAAKYRSRMHFHAVAEDHVRVQNRVRMDDAIAADPATVADDHPRMEGGPLADDGLLTDEHERIDRDPRQSVRRATPTPLMDSTKRGANPRDPERPGARIDLRPQSSPAGAVAEPA